MARPTPSCNASSDDFETVVVDEEPTFEYEFEIEVDDEEVIQTNQQFFHVETDVEKTVEKNEEVIQTNQQFFHVDKTVEKHEEVIQTNQQFFHVDKTVEKHEEVIQTNQQFFHVETDVEKTVEKQEDRHEERLRCKRERSGSHLPQEQAYPPSKKIRRHEASLVDARSLKFSQISCGEYFQDGRSVEQLVRDLMDGTVDLDAPFLRLNVFEDTTRRSKRPILKCSNNRRLFALKQFAKRIKKPVMVRVDVFDMYTIAQVRQFMANSDDTDGDNVRMRFKTNKTKPKNSSRSRKSNFYDYDRNRW